MIIDKLENVDLYPQIPEYARLFIKNLKKNVSCGRYELVADDFVNIETYQTKSQENANFETHKNYLDIQILLDGIERIYLTSPKELAVSQAYNPEKDIEFYSDEVSTSDFVTLDGSNFALIYPHEAHAPQVSVNNCSQNVKKVVLKLKI